ncbi:MAG: tRNA (adenosine(37)-N6)-threonylcarbamoyltransferase complex ATPase subunit type 1 TsaE [Candidatus Phosphoribacter sp.]|nr:tRNA (adenosine(37)-N6)-threonylcarbamoyltransferase complex ATPase subunit type 1 TsaE [Actinomycetales bacterium]
MSDATPTAAPSPTAPTDLTDPADLTDTHELSVELPDAEATRELGRRLAGVLQAGDLLVLAGDLGAGKTTLTQGLGAGLGVRGPVTSPTFVIARVHPTLTGGPALVHVDAYRLGSAIELDDLDLDTDLDASVVVVEWGHGVAEQLSADRVELVLRTVGPGEARSAVLTAIGERWSGALAGGALAAALGGAGSAALSSSSSYAAHSADADAASSGEPANN